MKILIDINHPSQVHLFKNAIWQWQNLGHSVLIVARDKDVTYNLLNEYGFKYIPGTKRKPGIQYLFLELFTKTLLIWKTAKHFKPDIFISLGSPPAAWAAFLVRKPHYAFTDTEHSVEQLVLYKGFSERIYTPECFLKDLGPKQIRYAGYHELAYLHPNQFTPNFAEIREFGLDEGRPYFVLRFVSFNATHDINRRGLSPQEQAELIAFLEKHGDVIVSSEATKAITRIGSETKIPPNKMHHLLAFASLFIGEGTTMATEAALLGAHSITLTPHISGNRLELENKYGLMKAIQGMSSLMEHLKGYFAGGNIKKPQEKLAKLLNDKIDVTSFIVSEIVNYSKELK